MSYMTNENIEWDVPQPFQGTEEEASLNKSTHKWAQDSLLTRICINCDAKDWHVAADYPCGIEPPRTTITQHML